MEFNLRTINRDSVEGKLLFVAIAELTTKVYTNLTPDEVIKLLWEAHKQNDDTINKLGANLKAMSTSPRSEFREAITRSVKTTDEMKQTLLDGLLAAGEIIFEHCNALPYGKWIELKNLLVELYRAKAGR